MSIASRALTPLAVLSALPLLATSSTAMAAPKAVAPVKATNEIIPLPLNPVVPAGQRLCMANTPSGLGYTMLRPATGGMPKEADFVLVSYIGYLAADGAVFDQAVQTAFPVNGVIPGFSEGLRMLPKGSVARFCIPATLGYGAEASTAIPANSDLVFQVELVDFKTAAEIEAMRATAGPAASESSSPTP